MPMHVDGVCPRDGVHRRLHRAVHRPRAGNLRQTGAVLIGPHIEAQVAGAGLVFIVIGDGRRPIAGVNYRRYGRNPGEILIRWGQTDEVRVAVHIIGAGDDVAAVVAAGVVPGVVVVGVRRPPRAVDGRAAGGGIVGEDVVVDDRTPRRHVHARPVAGGRVAENRVVPDPQIPPLIVNGGPVPGHDVAVYQIILHQGIGIHIEDGPIFAVRDAEAVYRRRDGRRSRQVDAAPQSFRVEDGKRVSV